MYTFAWLLALYAPSALRYYKTTYRYVQIGKYLMQVST